MIETTPSGFPLPSDDTIRLILVQRAAMRDYPLTPEDVRDHLDVLMDLVREKIQTLAGMNDTTSMTIVEALNTALMSNRWKQRNASVGT